MQTDVTEDMMTERELVITGKQRAIFADLMKVSEDINRQMQTALATVLAGHDVDTGQFVRFGDGKDGVFTVVIRVPKGA